MVALAIGLALGPGGPGTGGDAAAQTRSDRLLQALDQDGDGYISRGEQEAFRGGRFREMDRDGDGAVSRDEMMERFQRSVEREMKKQFDRLDRNRDGRIDAGEYGSRDGDRFDRLDLNGDGRISAEELKKRRK